MVIEENRHTNITRIDTWEQGWLLHVEDSLMGAEEVNAAPSGPLADIGSGAGFPGIPLHIVCGRQTTLVESVGKKALLLQGFTEGLEMSSGVEVFSGRVEALARMMPGSFAVITARALSSLPSLMELAAPLLIEGGRLVCYKSPDIEDELAHALLLQEKLAMRFAGRRDTVLSDGETRRSIIVFEKHGEPKVALPRNDGQAQRKPYKK